MFNIHKKGFTLVELLVVLVILVLIMSIAIPSVASSIERSKIRQKISKIEILEAAAVIYADRHKNAVSSEGIVTIEDLISDGLLTEEQVKDPMNEKNIICGYYSCRDQKWIETCTEKHVPPKLLINHIRNLYTSANPLQITHSKDNGTSNTYYYSYQDKDKLWGLMNDGLKVSNNFGSGAVTITDTSKLMSGTEGNIRYFGQSDKVNNYIYFNCSDYSNQSSSTCERWRIIGIVDGKVKIIREEKIGDLAWDQDKNQNSSLTTYSNNWETSSLQLFLNGLYYNRGTTETYTYYLGSKGNFSTTLNLKQIGITGATRNNSLISESVWYLGGYKNTRVYPNEIYVYERTNTIGTTLLSGNPYTINANIGLMYASDYGYGTDLTKCNKDIFNYTRSAESFTCSANNWLFFTGEQWLITPNISNPDFAWTVYSHANVGNSSVFYTLIYLRPVLYLNTELVIDSEGDGTRTNPYKLIV